MRHVLHALRNAFFSPGVRLFGLRFSCDYLRFVWRAWRQGASIGPGSLVVAGFDVDYWNQSHALFLLHEIFVNAEYDFETTSSPPRIIDCGANIGMSILFFKARYPDADILAFEADTVTFSRLVHTIDANRVSGVTAEQAAVTDHGGTVTLYRNHADPGSIVASIDRGWGGDAGETVPAVRLSDRIHGTVDLLKVDIEGAEYGVVHDLSSSGAIGWVREALIEYHNLPEMPGGAREDDRVARWGRFRSARKARRGWFADRLASRTTARVIIRPRPRRRYFALMSYADQRVLVAHVEPPAADDRVRPARAALVGDREAPLLLVAVGVASARPTTLFSPWM